MPAPPIARAALGCLVVLALFAAPAQGQGSASAPPFAVGANKAYCHAAEDSLAVWMNLLEADGGEVPYQIFGEPAATDPAAGTEQDPVANEAFEVRIPLSPALAQGIVVSGAVDVQAFIGSGSFGGGQATIGTSLVANGTVLGTPAAAKNHAMTPKNGNVDPNAPYDEITWTFEVFNATVPAGTLLEWVISGTVVAGNNVFLACHEARGRSSIELPVTALLPVPPTNSTGNSTTNSTTSSTGPVSSSGSATSRSTTPRSTTTSSSRSESGTDTTSGNGTEDDSKDTPATPLAFAGLAVLVAAVAVRRRLR